MPERMTRSWDAWQVDDTSMGADFAGVSAVDTAPPLSCTRLPPMAAHFPPLLFRLSSPFPTQRQNIGTAASVAEAVTARALRGSHTGAPVGVIPVCRPRGESRRRGCGERAAWGGEWLGGGRFPCAGRRGLLPLGGASTEQRPASAEPRGPEDARAGWGCRRCECGRGALAGGTGDAPSRGRRALTAGASVDLVACSRRFAPKLGGSIWAAS